MYNFSWYTWFSVQLIKYMHHNNVFITDGDDDFKFEIETESKDIDEVWKVAELKMFFLEYKRPWFISNIKPKHGGYRQGAGRKKEGKSPKTMPRRVPTKWADKIQEVDTLLALIQDWKDRSNYASKSSPRWEKLRELLGEIESIGFWEGEKDTNKLNPPSNKPRIRTKTSRLREIDKKNPLSCSDFFDIMINNWENKIYVPTKAWETSKRT